MSTKNAENLIKKQIVRLKVSSLRCSYKEKIIKTRVEIPVKFSFIENYAILIGLASKWVKNDDQTVIHFEGEISFEIICS